jgi:hypothetical protein
MRTFYEVWENIFSNRPLSTDEIAECNFLGGTDTLTDSTTTPQHVDDNIGFEYHIL